jgi:hypothetical protein
MRAGLTRTIGGAVNPACAASASTTLTCAVTPSSRLGSNEHPTAPSRRMAVIAWAALLSGRVFLQQLHTVEPQAVSAPVGAVRCEIASREPRQQESAAPVTQHREQPKPPSHSETAMIARQPIRS